VLDIPYILVGSLASNLYGIPRSTKDADFSVQVGAGGIRAIVARLGSQFRLDPQGIPGTHDELITASAPGSDFNG
jgi:hypothetical protein